MKKILLIILLFNCYITAQSNKKINDLIVNQTISERSFKDVQLKLIKYISFDSLSNVIYRPTFCEVNSKGEVFILDYTNQKINKFIFKNDYKSFSLNTFGNGKGKGPGELVNPTDFKIFKDTLYFVDPMKGTLEIYYKDHFINSLKFENSSIPERIIITNKYFIIEPQNKKKGIDLIKYTRTGEYLDEINIEKYLGDYKNEVLNNELVQDNTRNKYYLLPKSTGYLGILKEDIIEKFIYTIDGPRSTQIKMKKIMGNLVGGKIDIKFYTISNIAIGENFILVKAKDVEKDKRYYDLYSRNNFDYKFSIREMPYYTYISIYKNILYCVDDYGMKIYDISNITSAVK